MRIKHAAVFGNRTAEDCTKLLTTAIEKFPNDEMNFELMIEASAFNGYVAETRYTLVVTITDPEGE